MFLTLFTSSPSIFISFAPLWTNSTLFRKQVTGMLDSLDEFLKRIEPEIESITGEERDTASFMKMMRLFNEVPANLFAIGISIIQCK